MYYQRPSLDLDWLFLFVSLVLLVLSMFWQPSGGALLAEGFEHVLVLGASRDSNVMYITFWSPADANINFDNTQILVPAGISQVRIPLSDGVASFCVASVDYNDCGSVFAVPP